MRYKLLFILFFALLFSLNSGAQDLNYKLSDDSLVNRYASNNRVYYATRTSLKPKIDGILDDECWKSVGSWDGDFVQQQPYQAKAPSQQTEVKILYDDKYLYFALICYDNEPGKMSPILGRRDENNGDMAGIALDSYNDNQTAFEFNVTAAGQKVDLLHMGEYGWDFNWNAVWDGKSSVGDTAWYAEMRVPFTQLRFADVDEHVWGMHIWRWIYRLKEESQWKLIPIDAPAMVYIFGELRGIKDIPYKRNFEIMPYAKAKYIPDAAGNQNFGAGVDGKIGVTSNFNLDYTFNPDFGQVEADPSVLNLTSYEVFYEEKRPFFLEGNNILEFNNEGDMLFYSRRIGHAPSYEPGTEDGETLIMPDNTSIISALKLTGKNKKGLSLGIVNSMTSRENATIETDKTSSKTAVEPFTNYFIGRVKQDFNQGQTTIGGIVTSTIRSIKDQHLEFMPDNSTVGGIDFEHNWLNRKYFINAKTFYSRLNGTEEAITRLQKSAVHLYQREDAKHIDFNPDLTTLEGWGGSVSGGKRSGKFRAVAGLSWRSPGIDMNDVGYLRQADYIKQDVQLVYNINKPKGILNSYYVSLDQRHHWSYGGESLMDELDSHGQFVFKNLWIAHLDFDNTFNFLDTRQLRGGPALRIDNSVSPQFFFQTNSSKKVLLATGVDWTFYNDKISNKTEVDFDIVWQLSNRFIITSASEFSTEKYYHQYVTQKTVNNKKEYVVGKIDRQTFYTTLRLEYFITPELSLQYYGSPYASTGKYTDFRKVNLSRSKDLSERYSPLFIDNSAGNPVLVDENKSQLLDLTSENPDFDYQEFNSNFVLRWEYKTGSTFYFVWTNNISSYSSEYNPSVFDSIRKIGNGNSQNAVMVKFSYWFSL